MYWSSRDQRLNDGKNADETHPDLLAARPHATGNTRIGIVDMFSTALDQANELGPSGFLVHGPLVRVVCLVLHDDVGGLACASV